MTSSVLMVMSLTTIAMNPIDEILEHEWQRRKIVPSEVCSDDQFLRRISLDLIGRIPTVDELDKFRGHRDRSAQIDSLLKSAEFSLFQADLWTSVLIGYVEEEEALNSRRVLRDWLQEAIERQVPWDDITRDLIAAEGQSAFDGPVNFMYWNREEPAVRISRVFLGVRLDCARCHDHPFDRWTQSDFHHMARFFDAMEFEEVSDSNVVLRNVIEEADQDERPQFLTGARPRTSRWRNEFALYTTRCRPFARAFANRIWYQLFGRGIVHPVDDFNQSNPPVSPALLEHLADEAKKSHFDLRHLLRHICESTAYQRVSGAQDIDTQGLEVFATRQLRPLSPEQYVASISTATARIFDGEERAELLQSLVSAGSVDQFAGTWEYQENVQQLMSQLASPTPVVSGTTARLFNRILSRQPTSRESVLCRTRPRTDVIFALLHSDEFRFNH
jgi:hypothetical protein